jgi:hypothetical protein
MTPETIPAAPEPAPTAPDPYEVADALRRRVGETLHRVCQTRIHLIRSIQEVRALAGLVNDDDTAVDLMFILLADAAKHAARAAAAQDEWTAAAEDQDDGYPYRDLRQLRTAAQAAAGNLLAAMGPEEAKRTIAATGLA